MEYEQLEYEGILIDCNQLSKTYYNVFDCSAQENHS